MQKSKEPELGELVLYNAKGIYKGSMGIISEITSLPLPDRNAYGIVSFSIHWLKNQDLSKDDWTILDIQAGALVLLGGNKKVLRILYGIG